MKKAGIWVAGADASPEATDLLQADLDRDLALVIGGEGSGLSQLVKRECDYLVKIPDARQGRLPERLGGCRYSYLRGLKAARVLASSLTGEGEPPIY